MSQAQVKHVKRAQKDQGKCSGCNKELPVGSEYRYYKPGFRSRVKIRICMSDNCTPRRSQLESSKLSDAYSAVEHAEDRLNDTGTPENTTVEEIQEIIDECASEIRNVAEEYEASIEAAPMLEETVREKIERLEEFADELDSVSLEDPPEKPEPPREPNRQDFESDQAYEESHDAWHAERSDYESELEEWKGECDETLENARDAARDALSTAEF